MNNVILIGRISSDLVLRATSNGTSVCNFSIALNEKSNGNERTDFINITTYGIFADSVSKYKKKGDLIALKGKLRNDKYTDKDGKAKYKTYVVAEGIEFLTSSNNNKFEEESFHDNEMPW